MMLEEIIELEQESAEKEMPSFNHSYICWQISRKLSGNEAFAPLPELTLNIGNGITPNISVFPIEKVKPNFLRDKFYHEEQNERLHSEKRRAVDGANCGELRCNY